MEDKRVIPSERAQEVAQHHGIPFVETSAKTNINVSRAFHDMTLRILEKVSHIISWMIIIHLFDFFKQIFNFSNQKKRQNLRININQVDR